MRRLSRRKRIVFAAIAVVGSLVATVAALGVIDALLRWRYADSVALNRWGYRGPIVGAKRANERRVVVLGGSTAFGFGVPAGESFAAHLERRLAERRTTPVSVVNLGYVREGAWAFRPTLTDYAYLRYDVAVLYEGYNDLRRSSARAFRHDSPVFRATGYLPLLPLVLSEKARAIRYGGDLAARFGREDPVFRPDLADRAAAGALKAMAEVTRSLEQVLRPLSREGDAAGRPVASSAVCAEPFRHYCDGVAAGIEEALARGARVVVVTQPFISDAHVEQQRHLAGMVRARYERDPRVAHLDLGWAVDLRDPALAFDGMHLTPRGNALVAERLLPGVVRLLD
ncbi:MAG: SGNH/GDSL hydrolase family protein [Candidatus Rokubacteria bacterium]|nr:SGNH/GDSL hydrolase family protein [Candidatus Rokubacteria bacterium]